MENNPLQYLNAISSMACYFIPLNKSIMKKEIAVKSKKKETINSLKQEPTKKTAVKKGYNEKNPTQPQGAFIPDSMSKKK